ncbi:amidohydrolase family protein [Deminuibacter soli]|nr:amidohydrolase family protein [Deminuibacter soli]
MANLKFRADVLFTGRELRDDQSVLVLDDDKKVVDIIALADAGDDVQYHPGWLLPGLINCHCHLELSHLHKLVPEQTGLVDFVMTVMKQRHFPEAEIQQASEAAEQQMLRQGIVAVGDICNTAHTLPVKQAGRMQYRNFVEVSGFVPQTAAMRFQQAEAVYNQFAQAGMEQQTAIVPHAPYSVSGALFGLINAHSAGKRITMHNQETLAEERFFVDGQSDFRRLYTGFGIDISFYQAPGKSSLQACLPLLNQTGGIVLVHNTFTSEADIAFALQTGEPVYWALCPNANRYIENRMPPVPMLLKNEVNIVLGTDSLASNHQLSILSEIQTISRHYPEVPLHTMLQWATLNGAQALGLDALLGSFDPGKQPGVVNITGVENNVLQANAAVQRIV